MEKPFRYFVLCNKTNEILYQTNQEPILSSLQTYEKTNEIGSFKLEQTKTCYVDTRYDAKLRLYNYVTFTKKGASIPRYNPFLGTEIGKTIPILNF